MPRRSALDRFSAPSRRPVGDEDADAVSSLEKGLAVLERLSAARTGAGVTELARDLGLPKSSIARLLMALSRRGYVWREPPRPVYRLGPRALELTANALDELLVVAHARPHLFDLAQRLGRVAGLSVLWSGTAIIVDLVEPPGATPAALSHDQLAVGRGAPAYASSAGKAILAHRPAEELEHYLSNVQLARRTDRTIVDATHFRQHLDEVRARGWAANSGESTPGGTSVAAPVFGHTGEAIAALAVTHTHSVGDEPSENLVAAVMEMARRVSFNLGYHPRAFR